MKRQFMKYCVCGFEFLRIFLKIFVLLVSEEVCEIVFIISDNNDYEISTVILMCEVFTVIMGCLRRQTGEQIVKDWWRMVFTPDKRIAF